MAAKSGVSAFVLALCFALSAADADQEGAEDIQAGAISKVVNDATTTSCSFDDFVTPKLTPVEEAACFFAKHGWFQPTSKDLDHEELRAKITDLMPAASTDAAGLRALSKCYAYFKPATLENLTANLGGSSADLLGPAKGYNIDLFSVSKNCTSVISSLVHVSGGGVTAPMDVVKLCLRYFQEVVLERIFNMNGHN